MLEHVCSVESIYLGTGPSHHHVFPLQRCTRTRSSQERFTGDVARVYGAVLRVIGHAVVQEMYEFLREGTLRVEEHALRVVNHDVLQ